MLITPSSQSVKLPGAVKNDCIWVTSDTCDIFHLLVGTGEVVIFMADLSWSKCKSICSHLISYNRLSYWQRWGMCWYGICHDGFHGSSQSRHSCGVYCPWLSGSGYSRWVDGWTWSDGKVDILYFFCLNKVGVVRSNEVKIGFKMGRVPLNDYLV